MNIEIMPKRTIKERITEKWMAIGDYFKSDWTIKDWLAWIGGVAVVVDIVYFIIRLIKTGDKE